MVVAGEIAYFFGIIFHLEERLRLHIWHCFVAVGATIHLWAI
jgi:hemolysin III